MSEYEIKTEKEWNGLFKKRKILYRLYHSRHGHIYVSNDKEKIEKFKEKHKKWLFKPFFKVFELESGEYSPMYKASLCYDMNWSYSHLNPPEFYNKLENACNFIISWKTLVIKYLSWKS